MTPPDSQNMPAILNNCFVNMGTNFSSIIAPSISCRDQIRPFGKDILVLTPVVSEIIISLVNVPNSSKYTNCINLLWNFCFNSNLSKHIISSYLANIHNHCILIRVFRNNQTWAKVGPLYKCSNENISSNYRPILLSNHFSNIFEKLIYSFWTSCWKWGSFQTALIL